MGRASKVLESEHGEKELYRSIGDNERQTVRHGDEVTRASGLETSLRMNLLR